MAKSPDAFRTISEVADWLGVEAHVLRFWETKFTQVKPVKRAGGRRYYRPSDMALLGGIRRLLHDDGMTIRGVQKILREQGPSHVASLSPELTLDGGGGSTDDLSTDRRQPDVPAPMTGTEPAFAAGAPPAGAAPAEAEPAEVPSADAAPAEPEFEEEFEAASAEAAAEAVYKPTFAEAVPAETAPPEAEPEAVDAEPETPEPAEAPRHETPAKPAAAGPEEPLVDEDAPPLPFDLPPTPTRAPPPEPLIERPEERLGAPARPEGAVEEARDGAGRRTKASEGDGRGAAVASLLRTRSIRLDAAQAAPMLARARELARRLRDTPE